MPAEDKAAGGFEEKAFVDLNCVFYVLRKTE